MQKRILIFLLCGLIIFSCTGCTQVIQDFISLPVFKEKATPDNDVVDEEFADPNKAIYRNYGSAKMLTGRCVLVTVFISDSESSFNNRQEKEVMDKLAQAVDYITNKAALFGRDLELIYDNSDLIYKTYSNKKIPTAMDDFNWTLDILKKINSDRVIKEIEEKYNTNNVGFIFNVNKSGNAYALSTNESIMKEYYNEKCVVYSGSEENSSNAYIYAHEILHLFGALDLYYPDDETEDRKKLAESYFPKEIMLEYHYDVNSALVSDVTAYLVGWKDKLKKQYEFFIEEYEY